jgi:AMIN domain
MNRTRLLLVLLLLGSLGAAQSTAGGAAEVEQLQVKREGADVTVQVILTGSVKPSVETATNPDRLVLVLPGILSDAKQKHFPLDANGVRGVRMGLNSPNPPVTRVVVDLDSAHPYALSVEGNIVTLRVQAPESASSPRRNEPAPAATAPLISAFRRKAQSPSTDGTTTTAQTPIPVPPMLPPINFPEKQPPASAQSTTTASTSTPSATHPKLGSLQPGTVFPGMGTPGAGTVPQTQSAPVIPNNATPVASTPSAGSSVLANGTAAVVKAASPSNGTPTADPPASVTVSIALAPATPSASSASVRSTASNPSGTAATPGTGAAGNTIAPVAATASNAAPVPAPVAGSTTSSAGSPNVTAKVLSATVAPPTPAASASPVATVANPLGLPSPTNSTAASSTTGASQGTTVANPLGLASPTSMPASTSAPPPSVAPAAPQGATVANPLGSTAPVTPAATTATSASASATPRGATVANPLGLAPGESAQIEVVEPADASPSDVATETKKQSSEKNTVVAKEIEPEIPAALALRATHPDFRTAFRIKYVAAGAAYLDGGRGAGLAEGMKLVVRETATGSVVAAADGNADDVVAELEVTSVAEASAVTDVHTPKRDVKPGDLAYLSAQDEQGLVQQSTLSATRKYPTVISFTEGDTLDEEARVQVPRPPMPSVNRARGRFGIDYMGTTFHGAAGGTSTDVGLVARLDMTRIGGTYWNISGYWRGRLNSSSYQGTTTLQDLINRTYHLSMIYDNPSSPWVAGFGRMYLPWATSLDTIDGGYFGRRLGHNATLGVFAGSTPDPTSWSYSPDRRIGGVFVNFEGGSYDSFRYTSTSGAALSTIQWKIDRPFVFFENGIYYKRYVAIYDSLQADSPVGYQKGGSPGPGLARNFLTLRFQPHERIEFDANYSYFRDLPTFDPALVGTTLLDKYLFQGFSGGVRLEVLKNIWVYTNLGRSNRSGDTSSSLNELYGLTFGRLPWVHIRADGHYARFNSSFGSGYYESVSLSKSLSDNFRLEFLGGKQDFVSTYSNNSDSKFVTSNLEMNVGAHYFLQGGFTVSRGVVQNYDQWLFTLGYRFDTRRARGQ